MRSLNFTCIDQVIALSWSSFGHFSPLFPRPLPFSSPFKETNAAGGCVAACEVAHGTSSQRGRLAWRQGSFLGVGPNRGRRLYGPGDVHPQRPPLFSGALQELGGAPMINRVSSPGTDSAEISDGTMLGCASALLAMGFPRAGRPEYLPRHWSHGRARQARRADFPGDFAMASLLGK